MALIGYARVSTEFQNLTIQIKALQDYGCERIFTEKQSGFDDQRTEFQACINYLRSADKLVVYHIDRLSRNVLFSLEVKNKLESINVELITLSQMMDVRTPEGKFTFTMNAAIAQFQRDQISARTKAGLSAKKAQGYILGRPTILSKSQDLAALARLHYQGFCMDVLLKHCGASSRSTIYKYIKLAKAKGLYPK